MTADGGDPGDRTTGDDDGTADDSDDPAPTSDTEITRLDRQTVERIAAGEVVERPASVVKELVENSLDAGADRVAVAVESGGIDGIRVTDDGAGMSEADVRAAVQEHTTSKIDDIADLEGGVTTLGFRGEALHTIGAVSRMTVTTKPRGHDGAGTELVYEGGEVQSVGPAGCPEGTTIRVDDLFYNTPARRKYLKAESTEFAHVNRVVTRYALANPDVAVSLEHDGRETFATPGRGNRQEAVMAVYGREVAESMIRIDTDPATVLDDSDAAGAPTAVSGLVSHPETTRSTREYVSTFVNGRAVQSAAVREAVVEAYGNQLAPDRYPFVVLFLECPPDSVDVNVHPRKMEVRFDEEGLVRSAVREAVEAALLDHGLLRSTAPRGKSKAGEARVEPEPGAERVDDGRAAEDGTDGGASTGESSVTATDEAATADGRPDGTEAASTAGRTPDATDPGLADADTADAGHSRAHRERSDPAATDETWSSDDAVTQATGSESADGETDGTVDDGPTERSTAGDGTETRRFQAPTDQRTLGGDRADADEFDRLPAMRVLGQFHDTYLVAETDDGLVLVDQHAADERVNYERLREAFEGETTAQALAEPVELELTAGEAEAFAAHEEALSSLGFHAEVREDRTVAVTTVPTVLGETLDPTDLREALAAFVSPEEDGAATVDALADAFVADLACYPSVTGNTSLTEGSVVDLLSALDDCVNPYACPHGRPVVVELDRDELDARFERDYPGHGGRRD